MATNIPDNLKYTKEHDWVLVENDLATIGLTDFAQSSLGDIVFVELPEIGTALNKDDAFGVVESIKSVTDLLMPISGEVVEVNEDVPNQPEMCNQNPYGAWFIKVKISAPAEIDALMSPQEYTAHCSES